MYIYNSQWDESNFQILFKSLSYLKYCSNISPELIQTEKYFAGFSSFFPIPTPSKLGKL